MQLPLLPDWREMTRIDALYWGSRNNGSGYISELHCENPKKQARYLSPFSCRDGVNMPRRMGILRHEMAYSTHLLFGSDVVKVTNAPQHSVAHEK